MRLRYKLLLGVTIAYFLWVGFLSFVILERGSERLTFSFLYGFPMAVELALPQSSNQLEHCRTKAGGGPCKALSSAELFSHHESGRYKLGRHRSQIGFLQPRASFFYAGNYRCHAKPRSWQVYCFAAYEGAGPNGEEFFLCSRRTSSCRFPELNGVIYPRG